jgi:hypothetical protein
MTQPTVMSRVCAAIIAIVVMAGLAAAQGDDETGRTVELELIAATVWQAIVGRDAEALLRYASSFEDVAATRARLTAAGLACALWNTGCLRQQLSTDARVRIAVLDFFLKHPAARLRVAFVGMPGVLDMESQLDLAILTWVVPGSDADRKFPAHDLDRWGVDHVNTCMIHRQATGWRFHSEVGVFFCGGSLVLEPETR